MKSQAGLVGTMTPDEIRGVQRVAKAGRFVGGKLPRSSTVVRMIDDYYQDVLRLRSAGIGPSPAAPGSHPSSTAFY